MAQSGLTSLSSESSLLDLDAANRIGGGGAGSLWNAATICIWEAKKSPSGS